jgi:hypothetical protein
MPVTARLSRRFYEQFGDEITNELVDWLNSVDATYRSDLRELNEINFARFDAKVEQRLVSLESRLNARIDGLDAKLDASISALDAKLDASISGIATQMESLEQRLEARFAEQLTTRLSGLESRMTRWMITLWTSTMLAFVGLLFAVLRSK